MKRKKTAGELSKKAAQDTDRYNFLDLGYGLSEEVPQGIWECIDAHQDFFDIPEFCVVLLLADDNIICNAKRMKYYAFPFLPKPRPRQSVFLYRRATDDIQFLWSLPTAYAMASLSVLNNVDKRYARMKGWCDAFYQKKFFEHIREQAKIDMLSEREFLETRGKKVVDSEPNLVDALFPEAFDFDKAFNGQKVVDTDEVGTPQRVVDDSRET